MQFFPFQISFIPNRVSYYRPNMQSNLPICVSKEKAPLYIVELSGNKGVQAAGHIEIDMLNHWTDLIVALSLPTKKLLLLCVDNRCLVLTRMKHQGRACSLPLIQHIRVYFQAMLTEIATVFPFSICSSCFTLEQADFLDLVIIRKTYST